MQMANTILSQSGEKVRPTLSAQESANRQGKLRALMPYGHPADDFAHDLRALLAER